MRGSLSILVAGVLSLSCGGQAEPPPEVEKATDAAATDPLRHPDEVHLRNVRQITFGGENAEAYWSADGETLIFQSRNDGRECDQIYTMDRDGGNVRLVSTGSGKTTCAYLFPDGKRLLYSSTHLASPDCPPPPDRSKGYVWRLEPTFDIFTAAIDGSDVRRITDTPGYDAEATVSPDGSRIVFTSTRDGDIDLYTMAPDGSDVQRLTDEPGYDGGAFFSPDGSRIVWRASRPRTDEEQAAYRELLRDNAIRPMNLEIFVARADGSDVRQLTSNGAANFAPFFLPDGERVIFASNVADPRGRNFDLFIVDGAGSAPEQITFDPTFDGFPMFSPDGTTLVFASNRNASVPGETNIFLADWVENPEAP